MGALAEFERALIAERTKAGMKAARRRGKHLGRPPKLKRPQVQHAKELNINPSKIVLIGGSAGGHLALMAGLLQHRRR